jgi:hypothetical protein
MHNKRVAVHTLQAERQATQLLSLGACKNQ